MKWFALWKEEVRPDEQSGNLEYFFLSHDTDDLLKVEREYLKKS